MFAVRTCAYGYCLVEHFSFPYFGLLPYRFRLASTVVETEEGGHNTVL